MSIYQIDQDEPSHEFKLAWQAARQHLGQAGGDGIQWLRCTLNPPLAEHLSFCLGNQLVFVFVESNEFVFEGSRKKLVLEISQEARAIPCRLPMGAYATRYSPTEPGWGLVHAVSGQAVDPAALVSADLVEMSDWELHDFAIQIVRTHVEKEGKRIFSFQPSPHIDPSIWFQDDEGPCWVVVRSGRYPLEEAPRPGNLDEVRQGCARMSRRGFFASVTVANAGDAFDSNEVLPLYRGHGMHVRFLGLEQL